MIGLLYYNQSEESQNNQNNRYSPFRACDSMRQRMNGCFYVDGVWGVGTGRDESTCRNARTIFAVFVIVCLVPSVTLGERYGRRKRVEPAKMQIGAQADCHWSSACKTGGLRRLCIFRASSAIAFPLIVEITVVYLVHFNPRSACLFNEP